MKPSTPSLLALIATAVLVPGALVLGRGGGVLNGEFGIPKNVTSAFPSCGNCHGSFPNAGGTVTVSIKTAQSIRKGSASPVTVSLSGGVKSTRGGFSLHTNKGSFKAGTSSRSNKAGTDITHSSSLSRSWSFSFSSASTGLHEWTAVGNTVNGDGRTGGDSWGFYGLTSSSPGEVFRIFVNDTAVSSFGSSCDGTKGYAPIQGIPNNPAVGKPFTSEVHNVPSQTLCLAVLGLSNSTWGVIPLPLNLTGLGAKGCFLRVSMDVMLPALSTGGTQAGSGSAKFAWAIPNDTKLRGAKLHFQTLVFDKTANGFGMTGSHGLTATIQ